MQTAGRKTKIEASPKISSSAAGLKAFFKIAALWELSVEDQMVLLGLSSESTFHKWKKQPDRANLSKDTLDRISYVLGIYKDLQTLLPNNESADNWVKRPNKATMFAERSPLSVMKRGHIIDLYNVRQHLALARGI